VRLSVLTPSRNYERFLPDALQSVHAQGDPEAEHVVADGASTDGTLRILHRWADRVRFVSEPDAGQSDALNKAAAMAKGEWLGWLNADEFYLPGAFEAVHAALRQAPDADVVYGDCCLVDVDGRLLRLYPRHGYHPRTLRWYGPIMASCAVFVRASALPDRGWDQSLRRMMDWDLYLELAGQGARFAYLARPLAVFRVHDAQVTAAPMPVWTGEGLEVVARHGLAADPGAVRARRILGRAEHALRKLAAGAYRRQRTVRRELGGADLRWFVTPEARANAARLLRLGSRPTGSRAT
jgi:glycosyltransferase involved in cell wall biosynthesis